MMRGIHMRHLAEFIKYRRELLGRDVKRHLQRGMVQHGLASATNQASAVQQGARRLRAARIRDV
eukprot:scaffold2908_cov105-Isochrysis_galbana.AAC.2